MPRARASRARWGLQQGDKPIAADPRANSGSYADGLGSPRKYFSTGRQAGSQTGIVAAGGGVAGFP